MYHANMSCYSNLHILINSDKNVSPDLCSKNEKNFCEISIDKIVEIYTSVSLFD